MVKGMINRLVSDKGFGFIRTAKRGNLFFRLDELLGVDFDSLKTGQEMEFEIGQDNDGRLQAVKVRPAHP